MTRTRRNVIVRGKRAQLLLINELRLSLRPAGEGAVRLRVAGQTLGPYVLGPELDLALPANLPLGRVSLDLAWQLGEGARRPAVQAAAVLPALAPGSLQRDGLAWVLSGHALARFIAPVEDAVALHAVFDPPDQPLTSQKFEISIRDPGRARMTGRPLASFSAVFL